MNNGTIRNQLLKLNHLYQPIKNQYIIMIERILTLKDYLAKIGITDIQRFNDEIRFIYIDVKLGINLSIVFKNNTPFGKINFFRIEKKSYDETYTIQSNYIDNFGNISNDNLATYLYTVNSDEDIAEIIHLWLKKFVESDYFRLNED